MQFATALCSKLVIFRTHTIHRGQRLTQVGLFANPALPLGAGMTLAEKRLLVSRGRRRSFAVVRKRAMCVVRDVAESEASDWI